jgi:uncharacterized protein (TIGR02145 family)
MKKKNINWICPIFLSAFLLTALFNCKKGDVIKVAPTINIAAVTNITSSSATTGGVVTSDGGASVTSRGVCWCTDQNPTISNDKIPGGTGAGSFTSTISGLSPGTTYNVRAYAINEVGTAYSSQATFTTLSTVPVLTTAAVTDVGANSASSGGNITSDGGAEITVRGVCWSKNQNPTIADPHSSDGTGIGSFISQVSSLDPGTTYYIRAYATNSAGTAYGNPVSVSIAVALPVLTTTEGSGTTFNSTISGGNISSDGGGNITARGVCWSIQQNPSLTDPHTTDGTGKGSYVSQISGLNPATPYYIRAYATNGVGTAYGNQVFVTTPPTVPTLTTNTVTNLLPYSLTCGGNITSNGGAAVTARGVCWSRNQNPSLADLYSTEGTGTGNFNSQITGLSPCTTYYFRAYATNSVGTSYGENQSATTPGVLPTVITNTITDILARTATSGGNVTDDGGAPVTARGVCWSTSPGPTISNSKTTDGTGTGTYISHLTGLQPYTIYYLRAYATNCAGTAYGAELSFKTLVDDIDGNIYHYVTIGTQVWLVENMRVTKLNDGTPIPLVTDDASWSSVTTPRYCWVNNLIAYKEPYGALYNYATISTGKLCPSGWHVPNDTEGNIMANFLGGASVAGGKLKEAGTLHWQTPNAGATNETGFTALPGGMRYWGGTFTEFGFACYLWIVRPVDATHAVSGYLHYTSGQLLNNPDEYMPSGLSVRCIADY